MTKKKNNPFKRAPLVLGLVASAACRTTPDETKVDRTPPRIKLNAPGSAATSPTTPAPSSARANVAPPPPEDANESFETVATVATVDGPLRFETKANDPFRNGRIVGARSVVFPPTCAPGAAATCRAVAELANDGNCNLVKKWDTPSTTLLLLQSNVGGGNACNGGSMFFVSIARGEAPRYSKVIDYCGGPDPKVDESATQVHVSWPTYPPNRGPGPNIAGERWELDRTTLELKKRP